MKQIVCQFDVHAKTVGDINEFLKKSPKYHIISITPVTQIDGDGCNGSELSITSHSIVLVLFAVED